MRQAFNNRSRPYTIDGGWSVEWSADNTHWFLDCNYPDTKQDWNIHDDLNEAFRFLKKASSATSHYSIRPSLNWRVIEN
jgi:hypothetical protein